MTAGSSGLDAHSAAYERDSPFFEENRVTALAYAERIGDHLREHGLASVLSLGLGHAEVARVLVGQLGEHRLQRYAIVDGSARLIAAFRQSIEPLPEGLELIEGYFESFACSHRFDVIEAGFVLEHVEDPEFVLRRMQRFLTPAGRLFIAVPNARSLHRLLGHHAGFLDDMYALSDADRALGHRRYFDTASLTALVERSGFHVQSVSGLLLKPFTTSQMRALDLAPAVWNALMRVGVELPDIANAICLEASARQPGVAA